MPELKIGKKAQDFELLDSNFSKTKLSDFRGKKIVLYFYPKDDTSGCTTEACEFTEVLNVFVKKGAVVIGVSTDDVKSHQKFIEKYKLKINLLSDADKKVVHQYGVYREKSMYGKKYMGIVRTTFLIDEKGIIQKIWPKVNPAGHAKEVLAELS